MGVAGRTWRLRAPVRSRRHQPRPVGRRPGGLPQLHPSVPRADSRRSRGGLPHARHAGGLRPAHRPHRDAGTADAGAGRCPAGAGRVAVDLRARATAAVRHPRVVGLRDRPAARLPVQALRRAHLDARRVHGHPGHGRADHRRIRARQERAGAGADFARQRPGGRRRGRPLPHQPDHARRALPGVAAEPAGSARHRPAGHPRDLRRDGRAPEDAAQAHRAPGAARQLRARLRAHALGAADAGRAGHAGAQGRSSRWWPAETSPCWWRPPCAIRSCNCAASTRMPISSRATTRRWKAGWRTEPPPRHRDRLYRRLVQSAHRP